MSGKLGGPKHGGHRHLELKEGHFCPVDHSGSLVDVFRTERGVGALADDDRVFGFIVDGDDCQTCGSVLVDSDAAHVDTCGQQGRDALAPGGVVTDPAEERNFGPESGCGHCLVGALAASTCEMFVSQHRLAGTRLTGGP